MQGRVLVRMGRVCWGLVWQAGFVLFRLGGDRRGNVRCGLPGSGVEWQARYVMFGQGMATWGMSRQAWNAKNERRTHMVYQPKFTWAKGSHHKVDAQTAGEVCNSLEAEGRLTAADLVEESRPEEAPLHPEFEWDDSIAAEKYREVQAGGVIRHLVKVSIDVKEALPVRAFFPVTVSEKTYERIETIISVEDKRQVLLSRALSELKSFEQKYASLTELCSVFDAIHALEESE